MSSKGKHPFRLGCTSYVLPDEILPNVRFLADKVDDIELVLFESPEGSNMPGSDAFLSMQQIANENDLTYSVHFPIDRKAGAISAGERCLFRKSVIEIINATSGLPVSGYLLHFEGLNDENDQIEVNRWTRVIDEFCNELVSAVAIDPELICVENLGYSPDLHQQHIEKYGFSHCIDVGHLWRYGANWRKIISQQLENTRVIHLHGVAEGRDHLPLHSHAQQVELLEIASMLQTYRQVVTLEVFGENDTFASFQRFEELWQK